MLNQGRMMPQPPQPVTIRQVRDYRLIESDVYSGLSAELLETAGVWLEPAQVAWVVEQAQERLRKAVGR
jgi:hypothetical protein